MRPGVRLWEKSPYDYAPGRHLGLEFADIYLEELR